MAARALRLICRAISSADGTREMSILSPRRCFRAICLSYRHGDAALAVDPLDHGVSRLVCNGEEPAALPDGVLSALKAREDDRGLVRMEAKPVFTRGDKVRVLAGAFMDSAGLFDGMGDRDRVAVLLDLLGRKVRVYLDADLVAAA